MKNSIDAWKHLQSVYEENKMDQEDRAEWERLVLSRSMATTPPVWTPFKDKPQETAYYSEAHEIFFGGAAGAGKTGLGIGLALTRHRRSLILRRESVQVVEIVDQLKKFAGPTASWRSLGYGGVMRTQDGRIIEVGGCEHEDDKEKYQGRPHDLIVLDEATHFSRSQMRFLVAWNRHEDPKQHCCVLLPSNPPTTPEGRWIVEEFAPWLDSEYPNPAKQGELRWYTVLEGKLKWVPTSKPFEYNGEMITPRSRTFIPGVLSDNPILAATDYGARLQALDEPLRSQLLYGDFNAGLEDDAWQVIPTAWVRAAQARWKPVPPGPQDSLGVDVARGGKDKTVIAGRHGKWFAPLKKFPGQQTPDGKAVATLVIKEHQGKCPVYVDVIGIGSSAFDHLKECDWFKTYPVNNAEARSIAGMRDRSGRLRFTNLRAASYWKFREALDPNGPDRIALPPDNEMVADLCAPTYKVLASGIQVEKKEDIIDRLGRSPDCADALVMAWWDTQTKSQVGTFRVLTNRLQGVKLLMKFVVCSEFDLDTVIIDDHPTLLVSIIAPDNDRNGTPPQHGLSKLLDYLPLQFADIDPKDHQGTWDKPVPRWGQPCRDVMATKEHGKKLWSFLQKQRERKHEVVVFADDVGGGLAMSVAMAVCDTMRLPGESTIHSVLDPEGMVPNEAPNPHVEQVIKLSRHLTV